MSQIDSQFSSNKASPRAPQKRDGLFSDLTFYVKLNGDNSREIERLLREHDGTIVSYPDSATYVISNSALPNSENSVITHEWVRTCIEHQVLLPPEPFAIADKQFFSSVVFCLGQDFSLADKKALFSMLTFYGASYNESIQECTHHITLGNESPSAFYYRKQKHVQPRIEVVSPNWVVDSIKSKTMQPESNYKHTHDPSLLRLSLPALEMQDSQDMSVPTDISSPVLKIITSPVVPSQRELTTANHTAIEGSPQPPFPGFTSESNSIRALFSSQTSENSSIPTFSQTPGRHLAPPSLSTDRLAFSPSITITPHTPEPLPEPHCETPHALSYQIPAPPVPRTSANSASELLHKIEQPIHEKLPLFHNFLFVFDGYIDLIGKDASREWEKIVMNKGGHVAPIYNPKVTHVILRHMAGDTYAKALRDRKCIASAHWLNDVLLKEHLFPPCYPLHVPIKNPRPLEMSGFQISLSNFDGVERAMLKDIISVLGASYTSYFSKKHNFLVTNKAQGIKFQKAKQWAVPIVNARFLVDTLFKSGIPEHSKPMYRNVELKEQLEIQNIDSLKPLLTIWSQANI